MKVKVDELKVTVSEYPKEVVFIFDDHYTMQHFLLNLAGLELGK